MKVIPGLWVGSLAAATDLKALTKLKVTHILNMCARRNALGRKAAFIHMERQVADTPRANIAQHFSECFEFIDSRGDGNILVHCGAGISRP